MLTTALPEQENCTLELSSYVNNETKIEEIDLSQDQPMKALIVAGEWTTASTLTDHAKEEENM